MLSSGQAMLFTILQHVIKRKSSINVCTCTVYSRIYSDALQMLIQIANEHSRCVQYKMCIQMLYNICYAH